MSLTAKILTARGLITIRLFPDQAPITVANFANLIQRGYYNNLNFHRVIADFMVQGGCPSGSGTGGPGYRFEDECTPALRHSKPGILSMANAGPGTNGSQFFITHVATPWLDGKHTVFGEVIEGQAVIDQIRTGDKMGQVSIEGDTTELFANPKVAAKLAQWNSVLASSTAR
jgi:peptidyl-prolyl cis-trans isomerase B (cyclophilin B)